APPPASSTDRFARVRGLGRTALRIRGTAARRHTALSIERVVLSLCIQTELDFERAFLEIVEGKADTKPGPNFLALKFFDAWIASRQSGHRSPSSGQKAELTGQRPTARKPARHEAASTRGLGKSPRHCLGDYFHPHRPTCYARPRRRQENG